ncbi:protein phosphatase CheZ [Photobacterium sanguinicancri]|uniref:Protein phosphatase CheZ n=1 Tax=Photobacterium sanguinicancri TaxID=875932 RepID=A0ABX4G4B6_9GAMM|nr:protein phosphatase CheZ [Photobacterium sanguinicancri]KXI24157.1 protein phosphatase [Photobacterium sanguinicancri]OZS45675.1 protein phosphatase [Photobacterium sanguinicancri]
MITLAQAKQLVSLLEDGQQDEANQLVLSAVNESRDPMYDEVGKLTRQLHDSLQNFRLDPRICDLAKTEIPDARGRLSYVIDRTEEAANKTMDAVENTLPIADKLHDNLLLVQPQWKRLMVGKIELHEFKTLCHNIDGLLTQVEGDSGELRSQLTEILMAQDFQDLTGQIIRRVIELVHEVEDQLVDILKAFDMEQDDKAEALTEAQTIAPEGPIINSEERVDVMSSQDDVDDLLSSLGF